MKHTASILCLLALAAAPAWGQELDGASIELQAGKHMSQNVPIALPYDGTVPDEPVLIEEGKTGRKFPATIREGELVFVPEGAMPETSHKYIVKVGGGDKPERVRIEKVEDENTLEVYIQDKHFTSYRYAEDLLKPFLWPVLGEGEVEVTRAWPAGEKEVTEDHPHHKSLWTSYGDVNGVDCWSEGGNAGIQRVDNVTYGSGNAYGWIRSENTWTSRAGEPVVSEDREYRFYDSNPSARIMDVVVTFSADFGDVVFGDTKEGGIVSARMRDSLNMKAGTGTITLSTGVTGGDTWGKPAAWCDYTGALEGVGHRGLAIFDHPGNLRHPSRWHVRDYGLMGANCFGLSYFTENEEEKLNGDYTLKNGETLTFRYRVYVHSGDVEEANVDAKYTDYATPPSAAWVGEQPK